MTFEEIGNLKLYQVHLLTQPDWVVRQKPDGESLHEVESKRQDWLASLEKSTKALIEEFS